MESKELLQIIAYENGLEYIETTVTLNGYPKFIRGAVIGFQTFEEADKLAKEHGLCIRTFFKRDGWQLYTRNNNTTLEPLKIKCEDYGDDYQFFSADDGERFFADEVKPFLENMENFEDLKKFIKEKEEILDKIGILGDTEWVVTQSGRYYETIDKELMSWNNDGKTWVIGIMAEEI